MKQLPLIVLLCVSFLCTAMAQTKTDTAKPAAKPTSVEFKSGDAAELMQLRMQLGQLEQALKLVGNMDYPAAVLQEAAKRVNERIGAIIESYKMPDAEITTDDKGRWIGLHKKS